MRVMVEGIEEAGPISMCRSSRRRSAEP